MNELAKVKIDAQLSVYVEDVELVRGLVRKSKAERTLKEYAKQWRAFQTWCECQDPQLESLPASPETLARYIARRAAGTANHVQNAKRKEVPAKPSTIRQALAAIRAAHTAHRVESATSSELVRATLEGIERTRLVRPDRKAPVLKEMMHRMLEVLPDTLSGARDRALLLVGFTGAFRRSELVAFDVSDFVFSDIGITVLLRKSKTDQRGIGREVGLPRDVNRIARLCPMSATREWLDRSGITEGRVFRSVDRHGNIGESLGDRDVARILKRTAKAAGIDPLDLAGHSLRAGLVTTAAKADKSVATIMRQTGHGSVAMVMRYMREADLFTDNAAKGLL